MKKILAVLLATASVLSFAACKGKNSGVTEPADPDAFQSDVAAYEENLSNAIAQSIEAESELQEEIDEYIKKVGKTKKNSQLVIEVKRPADVGREFWKFEFKSDGKFKTKTEYYFLPTLEQYNAKVQIGKDVDGLKVVDKDKDMRMVAIRDDKFNGRSYDKMYENFTNEQVAESGYIVIE